jgi:ankyrin repeat protein
VSVLCPFCVRFVSIFSYTATFISRCVGPADSGQVEGVRVLLAAGAEKEARNAKGSTPLILSAQHGRDEVVAVLLAAGAQPNSVDLGGFSPLIACCERGHTKVATLLLGAGADKDQATFQGTTSLHQSAKNGHVDTIRALLAASADVNKARASDGATALFLGCQSGQVLAVKELLANGADVNKARLDLSTPLFVACDYGHEYVVLDLLMRRDVLVNTVKTSACPYKYWHRVHRERLFSHSNELFDEPTIGPHTSPLFVSCLNGNEHVVQALLGLHPGIKVNETTFDEYKMTPLYIAACYGHSAIVEMLLARMDLLVNLPRADDGTTALFVAAKYGHTKVVTSLLAHPAIQVEVPRKDGITPLEIAKANGQTSVVALLENCVN